MTARALAFTALALTACPDQASTNAAPGAQGKPVDVCQRETQTCVYAPGKLGVCTAREPGCEGGSGCLICVSLH